MNLEFHDIIISQTSYIPSDVLIDCCLFLLVMPCNRQTLCENTFCPKPVTDSKDILQRKCNFADIWQKYTGDIGSIRSVLLLLTCILLSGYVMHALKKSVFIPDLSNIHLQYVMLWSLSGCSVFDVWGNNLPLRFLVITVMTLQNPERVCLFRALIQKARTNLCYSRGLHRTQTRLFSYDLRPLGGMRIQVECIQYVFESYSVNDSLPVYLFWVNRWY